QIAHTTTARSTGTPRMRIMWPSLSHRGVPAALRASRGSRGCPLAQLPHLRAHLAAVHADLGEDRDRLLEVRHRLFRAPGAVQQPRDVVVEGCLEVPVADGHAQ